MDEATIVCTSDRNATAAQAGRLLCVSETIYPHGLNHGVKPVYGGMHVSGGERPPSYARIAGEEYAGRRALVPAGETKRHSSRQACGGGEGPHVERDGRR